MFADTLAFVALALLVYYLVLFLIALITRNNTVADVGWGLAFVLATLVSLYMNQFVVTRQILVTLLVAIWGVRLSTHLFVRTWGMPEDWRHAAHRQRWGRHWLFHTFFRVFIGQGVLAIVIISPVLWVNTYGGPQLGARDAVGLVIWLIGFLFEFIADFQLTRFKTDPKSRGKVLDSGLWRYSRHPNYFGEATMWWGIYLIALSVPGAGITLVGPLLITYMLLRVSGVPLLEKRFEGSPAYRRYQETTSPFIPLPPHKPFAPLKKVVRRKPVRRKKAAPAA